MLDQFPTIDPTTLCEALTGAVTTHTVFEGFEQQYAEMREWLDNVRETAEHKEMIELALIVREIASRGESERKMSIKILDAVLQFSDNQAETSFLNF